MKKRAADTKDKWWKGLEKSRSGLLRRVTSLFHAGTRLDERELEDLEEALIEADLGVSVTTELVDRVRARLGRADGDSSLPDLMRESLLEMLRDTAFQEQISNKPHVILIVGVNGTGKTTTAGKLAARFTAEGKRVLLACADTFRAAAAEQLEIWAKRSGAGIVRQETGSDPASVAFDALEASLARGSDVLLVDTAGRLHNKINLMEELKKIHRVLGKKVAGAPHEVLLVLDATTGQNGLSQARLFTDAVGVSGIVLTKLDGSARGGIAAAIQKEQGIPICWVGLGEGLNDLVPFEPEAFVEGLLGGAPEV